MKILKLVLIAILTVSIYSFTKTSNETKNLNQTCLSLTFKSGLSDSQKGMARRCFEKENNLRLFFMVSSTDDTEIWHFVNNPITDGGKDTKITEDDDPKENCDAARRNLTVEVINCN